MDVVKTKLDKEEIKNLIKMMRSHEADNHVVALMAINEADLENFKAELLVIYQYGKLPLTAWKEYCPNGHDLIHESVRQDKMFAEDEFEGFASVDLVRHIVMTSGSKQAVELMLEHHIVELTHLFEGIGYKFEDFSINIKFKDE